jgi:voltage-gated potassium channel
MANLKKTPKITASDNYFWLLIALLVLFFFSALFEQLGSELLSRLMGVMLTTIILVAVWSIERLSHQLFSRVGITVLLLIIVAAEYIFEHYSMALLQLITILGFTVATIVIASKQVLLSGSVDGNKIIGAICIYMFLAIAWAMGYLLVEQVFPGSLPALEGADWRQDMQKAVYYSFVTITTLGFGDISPAQPLARYLTYLEAVTGQFYIAILVASLIGVRLSAGNPADK